MRGSIPLSTRTRRTILESGDFPMRRGSLFDIGGY